MKKLPYIIGIPAVAVFLVLGGAMVWRVKNQATQVVTTAPGTLPNNLGNAKGNTPSNAFGGLFGQKAATVTPIPTPTPASVAVMSADVNAIGDDGGAADFSSLQSTVSGL